MPNSHIQTLRTMLREDKGVILPGAPNALAARIIADLGFRAVYLTGAGLTNMHLGLPDLGFMDLSLVADHVMAIRNVIDLPLIVDIDTGFGNAVNVAYVVPQYAAAGVAAVVIEDKTFPKDTSLRPGGRQELVPIGEFQGKVAAAKAAGSMLVIARTEALIAGRGQEEALRRGAAYAEAGADAVLIHSKEKAPDEILAFCRAWPGRVPLVLVPTSYPQLAFADIAALGKVGLIICGNHAIRAAVAAMQNVFRRILAEGGIAGAEKEIASVGDVFALQGDVRMREIEKAFLR